MIAGVSSHTDAVFIGSQAHAEVVLGVLEKHFSGSQPAAFQGEADGRRAPRFHFAGNEHRFPLASLDELDVAANWTESEASQPEYTPHIFS